MMAYILLQRGGENPTNRWQYAMNSMPPGVLSRPGQLNSGEALQLVQRMNQFYQFPNFDPAMQHNMVWSQLSPQVDPSGYIPQEQYLNVLSAQPNVQPYIW